MTEDLTIVKSKLHGCVAFGHESQKKNKIQRILKRKMIKE